jgi:hypothetical protein
MSHWVKPPRVHLLVNEDELRAWLAHAEAGAALEYHRGALVIDRLKLGSRLPGHDREVLDGVARAALAIAESGNGYLLQRRHGPDDYSYFLVARPKSAAAARGVVGISEGGES